jgi:two-component system OmpR family response regulator
MSQGRLLIVDDDGALLGMLKAYIKQLLPDHQVIGLQDGAAALTELRRQPFDLILTDYMMRGINGLDLAQAIHQISPNLPVILMTGRYSYNEIQTRAGSADLAGFLAKPFTMWQLRKALQENGFETGPF